MMEFETYFLWNVILTLVILPAAWYIKSLASECQRIQILLNITREEYMKRSEHNVESDRILDHLKRLEDKVDRLIESNRKN